jgi:ABC-type multidrug transport system permease subunit
MYVTVMVDWLTNCVCLCACVSLYPSVLVYVCGHRCIPYISLLRVRFFLRLLVYLYCVIVIASSFKSRDVNEKEERVTPLYVF